MVQKQRKYYKIAFGNWKRKVKYAQISEATFDLFFSYDKSVLYSGKKLTKKQIDDLHQYRLFLMPGDQLDYLNSPWGLFIFSQRFWSVIQPYVNDHVQVLKAPFYYEDTGKDAEYLIINPLLSIHAKYAGGIFTSNLAIDIDKISEDVHLFRLAWRNDNVVNVLFSNHLKEIAKKEQLTGISWLPVQSKDEYEKDAEKTRQMIQMSTWEYTHYYLPTFDLTWQCENDQYVTKMEFEDDGAEYAFTDAIESGKKLSKDDYSKCNIFLSRGDKTDYVSNSEILKYDFEIISKRFYNKIKSLLPKDLQILSIPMFCEETKESIDDYVVLYLTNLFIAEPSRIDPNAPGYRIIKGIIPNGIHAFQVASEDWKERRSRTQLFSQAIKDVYDKNSFKGCIWLPTFWIESE